MRTLLAAAKHKYCGLFLERETTNEVFNNSLFDKVTTDTVPYWARVTVATRGATTAEEWHDTFYKYNSGELARGFGLGRFSTVILVTARRVQSMVTLLVLVVDPGALTEHSALDVNTATSSSPGTYNNQWMTLDYKKFTPNAELPAGTFWVSEQIPGHYVSQDQTHWLQGGHWSSYNVPFCI